jgi:hypothetical protein
VAFILERDVILTTIETPQDLTNIRFKHLEFVSAWAISPRRDVVYQFSVSRSHPTLHSHMRTNFIAPQGPVWPYAYYYLYKPYLHKIELGPIKMGPQVCGPAKLVLYGTEWLLYRRGGTANWLSYERAASAK